MCQANRGWIIIFCPPAKRQGRAQPTINFTARTCSYPGASSCFRANDLRSLAKLSSYKLSFSFVPSFYYFVLFFATWRFLIFLYYLMNCIFFELVSLIVLITCLEFFITRFFFLLWCSSFHVHFHHNIFFITHFLYLVLRYVRYRSWYMFFRLCWSQWSQHTDAFRGQPFPPREVTLGASSLGLQAHVSLAKAALGRLLTAG